MGHQGVTRRGRTVMANRKRMSVVTCLYCILGPLSLWAACDESGLGDVRSSKSDTPYLKYVRECVETLIEHGTDRYGSVHSPILVSILDVESRICPENPLKLDEDFRVGRRGRRNPAGANLLTDQKLLETMFLLSAVTGEPKYEKAARAYMDYYLKNLVDEKGFFWWGWHRHYDVYRDTKDGHLGNPHEIHAINGIAWDRLWQVNPDAVRKEIEAIWTWHVIDKQTGEINRHGDGRRGCDFSMSAGSFIHAFAFLYGKTKDEVWLERAKLLAGYYWNHRNADTDLFAERPNAGSSRFDGSSFVTSITGPYCRALLKAYEITAEPTFKDQALAHLRAYARYGSDRDTGKFWGALKLDGTVIPGPRVIGGYAQYEPRGHLDLWQPYAAGYEHPLHTALTYAYAYQVCEEQTMSTVAQCFAKWIATAPPSGMGADQTWYEEYSRSFGRRGTYAGKYGQAISLFLHLYILTKNEAYLSLAEDMAGEATEKLAYKGLFRGHPAKPYYEAMDGVGYLLYALLELDQVLQHPQQVLARQSIAVGEGSHRISMPLDNW